MNRYPITELIARWSGGSLTVEQIVLTLQAVEQRQQDLDQQQRAMERRLEAPPPPESAPPATPKAKGRRSQRS